MLFSSIVFLFYFLPIVLFLYYSFKFSRRIQNIILLISSLIFYAWGGVSFLTLMIISIIFNYILGLIVHKYNKDKPNISKIFLIIACIGNLSVLFVFKYLTFILRNIDIALGGEVITVPNIILPIGISFFTFQAMSYVIDVYRKTVNVQKNIFYLGLYIALFPQLIAGPIVRYSTIEFQIQERKESLKGFSVEACRFIIGLSKKSSYIK